MRLLQKSTVSQSCLQDYPNFAERMKRKALRVRSEESIPPYVTEAEFRKQRSDSPLCNNLKVGGSRGELVVGAPTTKVVLPEERVVRYERGRCDLVPRLVGGEGELATGAVEVSHGS